MLQRPWNQQQVAEVLAHSVRTLERWRRQNFGPAYRKIGRRVVYDEHDVRKWLDSCLRTPTPDTHPRSPPLENAVRQLVEETGGNRRIDQHPT